MPKVAEVEPRKRTRRRQGRPSKLTRGLIKEIADLIQDGNYKETAAQACGVSRRTYVNWQARGEELEGLTREQLTDEEWLYVEFLHTTKHSEALSEVELVALVRQGKAHWQAPMTMLERRFPARWKKRDETEHTGAIEVNTPLLPGTPEYEREMEAFAMPAARAVEAGDPDAVQAPEDA